MKLWLVITWAPQVVATGTGPVEGLTDRPVVPEDSKLALLDVHQTETENTSDVMQGAWGDWFFQNKAPSGGQCQAYKNYVKGKNYQSVGRISIWTNLASKISCTNKNAVQNLMYYWQRSNSRYSVVCDGRWWRVGPCGGWQEICAGCSSICTCNSGMSIRPCIGNSNWGGSGTTCSAARQILYMDIVGAAMRYSYYVQRGQSCTREQCDEWLARLHKIPWKSGGPLTVHSSYNGAKYVCSENSAVNNIIHNLNSRGWSNHYCNGQWWRTGTCGGLPELCVGCSSICQCSGLLTYRPCIMNSNFGGAGTSCSPPSQTLTMTVGSGTTTTTTSTSTTTTTTTTTKIPVLMKTFMLPEFSSWVIKNGAGKTVCKGNGYSNWYETVKVDCKLKFRKTYRVTCMNSKVGGWTGGYLQVKNKKLCQRYKWSQGNSWTETFTAQ